MATHPCTFCGARVRVGAELVSHLDACRSAAVIDAARAWGIDGETASLFVPGTHDKGVMAAVLPPQLAEEEEEGGSVSPPASWYATAASAQHGVAPLIACPHLAAADSPANHALIVLPAGPSYVCGPDDMSEILCLPHVRLLVGSEAAARSPAALSRFGVRAIVNCAVDSHPLPPEARRAAGVGFYHQLQLVDAPGATNLDSLRAGAAAVEEAVRHAEAEAAAAAAAAATGDGGAAATAPPPAVLIHCVAGISRSTSVTIAYLMTRRSHSLRAAALLVKRARKVAYPNIGFLTALREIERDVHGGVESIPDKAFALHKSCPLTALRIR